MKKYMYKLFVILSLIILSCNPKKTQFYDHSLIIIVTPTNCGKDTSYYNWTDKDTICYLGLRDGCLLQGEHYYFTKTLECGVRKFEVLDHTVTSKSENLGNK